MSSNWLCTRTKLLQIFQIRSLTNSAWLQNRCNTLSLDAGVNAANLHEDGCLLNTDLNPSCASPLKIENPLFDWKERNSALHTIEGSYEKPAGLNTISKYDILTFLRPLCARNPDLIKSLAKVVEPVECNDIIHVGSSAKNCTENSQPLKTCNRSNIHAFNSFDSFSAIDQTLHKDTGHCLHMNASDAAVKTQEKEWCSNLSNSASGGTDPDKDDERKGPTIMQLEAVKEYYIEIVPGFHKRGEKLSAGLHHEKMVFENHFFKKPKVTVGLTKYSTEISKIRAIATFFYPSYHLEIQSILSYPNEGYVKMHWRAYVVSNWKFVKRILMLMKDYKSAHGGHDTIDAISTFHVNRDGKIVLHKLDRKIPLQSESAVTNLAAKTVEMVGLAPKSSNCESTSKENL
ncbi:uncharacterized protein LOC123551114 [Mercenaria mercenaria]|uniref:uncharacterized protein LOC123551114 n=1 Tax=Mercenaria mercenaria TaxID=6596 RepID=UPI00234E9820|nr:uncharacterized protein LOC123551114 [Mercenaria mercenaria]